MELLYEDKNKYKVLKFTSTKESSQLFQPDTNYIFNNDQLESPKEYIHTIDTTLKNSSNSYPSSFKATKYLRKLEDSLNDSNIKLRCIK